MSQSIDHVFAEHTSYYYDVVKIITIGGNAFRFFTNKALLLTSFNHHVKHKDYNTLSAQHLINFSRAG